MGRWLLFVPSFFASMAPLLYFATIVFHHYCIPLFCLHYYCISLLLYSIFCLHYYSISLLLYSIFVVEGDLLWEGGSCLCQVFCFHGAVIPHCTPMVETGPPSGRSCFFPRPISLCTPPCVSTMFCLLRGLIALNSCGVSVWCRIRRWSPVLLALPLQYSDPDASPPYSSRDSSLRSRSSS